MSADRPVYGASDQRRVCEAAAKGRGTARSFAVREIRAAIRSGQLLVGEAIREDHWSSRLGVSRTPLREAIAELCVEGFLRREGRSVYVFRPSLSELWEIYDMREELEVLAARRSVGNRTPDVLDKLGDLIERVRTVRPTEDWFSAHERFHVLIAEASGMPRLANLVTSLREQSEPYVRIVIGFDESLRREVERQHEEIYQCMLKGDSRTIAGLVRRHLQATRRQVERLMPALGDIARLTP